MSNRRLFLTIIITLALLAGLAGPGPARAEDQNPTAQSSYRLQTVVMGSAGAPGASPAFSGKGTAGQPTPVGVAAGSGNLLYAGFWAKPWSVASVLDTGPTEIFTNRIYQNFPNPFIGATSVAYTVASETEIEVAVFDVRGRKVRTLVRGHILTGRYVTTFDGRDDRGMRISPGVYFYRLTAGDWREVKKMIVLE